MHVLAVSLLIGFSARSTETEHQLSITFDWQNGNIKSFWGKYFTLDQNLILVNRLKILCDYVGVAKGGLPSFIYEWVE